MSSLRYDDKSYQAQFDKDGRSSRSSSKHKSSKNNAHNGLIVANDLDGRHRSKRPKEETEGKFRLKKFEDWSEQISKAGKKYYYNCRTEVSQWEKPQEWIDYERKQYNLLKQSRLPAEDSKVTEPYHSLTPSTSAGYGRTFYQNLQLNLESPVNSATVSTSAVSNRSSGTLIKKPVSSEDLCFNQNNNHSSYQQSKRPDDQRAFRKNEERPASSTNSTVQTNSHMNNHGSKFETSVNNKRQFSREHVDNNGDKDDSNLKKRRLETSSSARALDKERVSNQKTDSSNNSNCQGDNVDAERLPHLLVEIAERNNINLADVGALEKIKRHLKSALQEGVAEDDDFMVLSAASTSSGFRDGSSKHDNGVDRSCDIAAENHSPDFDIPALPPFSSSHVLFYKEQMSCNVKDWAASHFENQALTLSDRSFQISLEMAQVSADLKCSRSLVRTAEIRSTLLDQRISYLRKQYYQLESMNKPTPSTNVFSHT